ncbi:uncharacterized protein LOC111067667 isoform X1 [Drosophila obscura]|uniref:uncharacterized protein LOC111067667 isoform X1 n=1 Tax=Drosophila obscura TaxID=7282 RepID=UPI001BB27618|nr:uncharacterized protein LOC111067667 isoform X1 [Drosophila obscura]
MKFHLVLAVVLCSITASLCSEEEQISSANMSSIAIAKKLIEKSSIQCFLNWLSRLGKNAGTFTTDLAACTTGYGDKSASILTAFVSIATKVQPIVTACAGIIANAVIGGLFCIKEISFKALPLVRALKQFHDACSGEPRNATQCAKNSFKKFFSVTSVYEIIDSCLYPEKCAENCEFSHNKSMW